LTKHSFADLDKLEAHQEEYSGGPILLSDTKARDDDAGLFPKES
jgi:hypothetical protein